MLKNHLGSLLKMQFPDSSHRDCDSINLSLKNASVLTSTPGHSVGSGAPTIF